MIDLLVMGAGLSGLMAAYTAAKAGLTVRVIAKGLGAIHWTAATVDVFGYAPDDREHPVQRPLDFVEQLAAEQPDHPYALIERERLAAALDSFVALTQEIGLPYSGAVNAGDNLLLPSPAGAARPTYLAPQAQLAGDLSRPEPMVIVGFQDGMRDFYPQLVAENLSKLGFEARAAFLPFSLITDRHDSNTVQQAEGLDDPARRARLADELRRIARPGERIGLPAILGLDDHMATLAALEAGTGAPIFEIPTLPPSAPGVRLYKALRKHLLDVGVRVYAGMEAIGFRAAPADNGAAGRVSYVETETSARPLKHRAAKFLLATGGILGGGFNSDHSGRVWEVIFDLPLTTPQQRSQWFRPTFLHPEGHPVFSGGVTVDRRFQPLDGEGRPVFANLWAAGNLLANDNPILQRSMEGAAIATGVAAAQAIVEG